MEPVTVLSSEARTKVWKWTACSCCWQSLLRDHAIKVENNMPSHPKKWNRNWQVMGYGREVQCFGIGNNSTWCLRRTQDCRSSKIHTVSLWLWGRGVRGKDVNCWHQIVGLFPGRAFLWLTLDWTPRRNLGDWLRSEDARLRGVLCEEAILFSTLLFRTILLEGHHRVPRQWCNRWKVVLLPHHRLAPELAKPRAESELEKIPY